MLQIRGGEMGTLQEKIAEFTEERKNQGASANTVDSYGRDLHKLAEYLQARQEQDCCLVTEKSIRDYLYNMEAAHKSPATISRAIASIKAFFRYLEQTNVIAHSPAARLKAPRIQKNMPHVLQPEEIVQLLQQPSGDCAKSVRDRAMLELLYATGIRVSELLELKVQDVNLAMEYIVCCQGGRERVVPFGRAAKEALAEYLSKARGELEKGQETGYLFMNMSGQKMSRQGFWKLVKQYAGQAGIEGGITPHTLRHSFAAHLVSNGAGLYAVQELMGYADLSGTQVYAKMSHVPVREAYKKAHPRK